MAKVFFFKIIIKHSGDVRTWLALKKIREGKRGGPETSLPFICLSTPCPPLFFHRFSIPYLQLHYKFHLVSSCLIVTACIAEFVRIMK